jgi:hypothetical protein
MSPLAICHRLAASLLVGAAALAAPAPMFQASFDGSVEGRGADGKASAPIRAENVTFADGLKGKALVADGARLIFPHSVIPADRGTVEIVASPLAKGTGEAWMFLCGDAAKWGPVGVPRLWRWNGQPRFDMDSGTMAIYKGTPSWFDWSVGTWHVFTGTWDRTTGHVAFYLDGRLVGSRTVPPWEPEASSGFAIGSSVHIGDKGVDYAHALIDSVAVFDEPLSATQIQLRFRNLGLRIPLPPSVAAHPDWRNALEPTGTPGPELPLASDGTSAYRILLPKDPTTMEEKAAADLALWLEAMTGVSLPLVFEDKTDDTPVISIGHTERLAQAKLPASQEDLAREGYGIGVKGQDLFLWGGSGRGVINAVYALLEEDLGCRWYHRDSVTIPHRPDLAFRPVPRTFVPVLEIRDPYYWDAFDATWSLHNRTNSPNARVPDEWGGRIRYAGGFFVHTYNRLVPPKTYFKDHPEYYSEINGKRVARQLCLSNPDVLRIATETVRKTLRKDPGAHLLSVSPNDGRGYCECAQCRAFNEAEGGTEAATNLRFVNRIADAIKDEFPDVKISTLAYLGTVQPPKTIRPRENVVIRLCTDRHAWSHFFEFVTETDQFSGAMKAWSDIGAKIHIWDYTVNFSHYSLPSPNMPLVTQNVRWMMHHNAKGIMLQGAYQSPGSARGPLRSWVWAKQLWDPTRNTRDLIRDFTYGFYGEAAEPMQAYNELLWRLWEEEYMGTLRDAGNIRHPPTSAFLSPAFAAEATRLFAQAESLAKSPETKRRVELAKFALLYLKLSRGPGFVPGDDFGQMCDEFQAIAKREKVNRLWEDWRSKENHVDKKLAYWRGLAKAQNAKFSALRIGPESMFRPDPKEVGDKEGWFAPDYADLEWARIKCGEPGGWDKQGFDNLTGTAWYRLRFDVPADFGKGRKIRIFIGAADEDCTVYLNGKQVCEHTCAATKLTPEQIWNRPFLFDPGADLKLGAENVLALKIHNRLAMGGVWKPIYLLACEEEPEASIVLDMIRLKHEK